MATGPAASRTRAETGDLGSEKRRSKTSFAGGVPAAAGPAPIQASGPAASEAVKVAAGPGQPPYTNVLAIAAPTAALLPASDAAGPLATRPAWPAGPVNRFTSR